MANFALLVVRNEHPGGIVDGYWLQDCSGCTLEKATGRAELTKAANGGNLVIAVVDGPTHIGKRFFLREKALAVV